MPAIPQCISRGVGDPSTPGVHCPATTVLLLCVIALQISRNPERVGTACHTFFSPPGLCTICSPCPGALFPFQVIRHLHVAVTITQEKMEHGSSSHLFMKLMFLVQLSYCFLPESLPWLPSFQPWCVKCQSPALRQLLRCLP